MVKRPETLEVLVFPHLSFIQKIPKEMNYQSFHFNCHLITNQFELNSAEFFHQFLIPSGSHQLLSIVLLVV